MKRDRQGAPGNHLLPIRGFKEVNDTCVTRSVMSSFARPPCDCAKPCGGPIRSDASGGDEFLVICPHVASRARSLSMARRLHRAINALVTVQEASISCAVSVGVIRTEQGINAEDLVAEADRAMYDAKTSGRPVPREAALASHPSLALSR